MALLSTEDSKSVGVLYLLFTQPSLIRSFHSSDPCFFVSCPKGVGYARVYCNTTGEVSHYGTVGLAEGGHPFFHIFQSICILIKLISKTE